MFSFDEGRLMRQVLGYFNRTQSEVDYSWEVYEKVLFVEVILIILSLFYIGGGIFVISTAPMHRNVRVLNVVYYGQYFVQLTFWVYQPILTLIDKTEEYHIFFTISGLVRQAGLIHAFFVLPALVVERSFATFLVQDYEKSSNSVIGNLTLLVQIVIACCVSISFIQAESTVPHICIAVCANSIAFMVNKYNEHVNSQYYHNMDKLSYSLSERFQITENIRAAKMFNKIVYSIGIFNIIVNACMIIDNYDIPNEYRNLSTILCDYSVLMYGFVVPWITYLSDDGWQKRINYLLGRANNNHVAPLKDTFGHDMRMKSTYQETSQYFDMLADQWKK